MKTLLFTLISIIGLVGVALANNTETVALKMGQKKSVAKRQFTIKLMSVTEDSRCPTDSNCIWAGNAKVNVKVTDSYGNSKVLEMNTTMGPKGDQFNGYAINLTALTPSPKSGTSIKQRAYTATFSVVRLTR